MICPNCKAETEPSFFCHSCDIFLHNPAAGARAGVARRLLALLLDGILVWVVFFIILLLAGLIGGAAGSESGFGLSLATFFWTVVGYTVFSLWFLSQGKTPGKWLVGIRAVNKSDGEVPGLGRMLVREIIGKFFSGLFFGLGYLWAIWDRDAQAWHDKIAGTLVVRRAHALAAGGPEPSESRFPEARPVALSISATNPLGLSKTAAQRPAMQTQQKFCEQCGSKVGTEGMFCEECGARIEEMAI